MHGVSKKNKMTLISKDNSFVWHPFDVYNSENLLVKKAKGIYIFLQDGRKIVDGISSWWVNLHGHRNTTITNAVSKQLRYFEHVIFAGFTHQPAIHLAENLCKCLPGEMKKVFYSDNGSTSTEVALKMSMHYWHNKNQNKKVIIAIEGSYHGDTFGAMSVAERGGFNLPFEPYLFDVKFISFPNNEESIMQFSYICQTNEVAAFIYEPLVQGSSGMRIYKPEILEKLLKIAKINNIICIADEVMTGFGRTNTLFASNQCETKPDIICLSKGLTGGYLPLGATAVNQKIINGFESKEIKNVFLHGHSYTANPLACAAALASLKITLSNESIKNRKNIELWHRNFIEKIKEKNYPLKRLEYIGTILVLEIDNQSDTSYFNSLREYLYIEFLNRNILLRPLGNVIYVLPPYIISKVELNKIYKAIEEILNLLSNKNLSNIQ